MTKHYLNVAQIEERLGLARNSLSRIKLPTPDVIVGPVEEDGSPSRGTVRGWLPATIDKWNDNRPGRGVGGGRPRKSSAKISEPQ